MKFLILLSILHTLTLTYAITPTPSPTPTPACFQSPDPGPCNRRLTRFHYDFSTNACAPFIWGGCDGTVPFETLEECENSQCGVPRCQQSPDPGPCRGSVPAFFYNATSEMCERFTHGGCGGVVPFKGMMGCKNQCMGDPCELTPRSGPCQEDFERFFFNATTEQCEPFRYGGCRGVVPFETRGDCRRSCRVRTRAERRGAACDATPDPGPCRAFILRYFYNSETMRCESFAWGGCQGSVPFETLTDCRNAQCNPLGTPDDSVSAGDDFDITAEPGPRITNPPRM